jgi:DNA anti-recombination protein RmuC
VEASLGPLMESWRSMTDAHQSHLRGFYAQLGDESVEQYKKRLENVSNSWMVATVSSLDHQSRDVISGVTQTAEEKLRETCNQVFGQAAEALRQRLQEIGATFLTHPSPQSQK